MSMPDDILDELQKRLPADFGFKVHGKYYQQGKCPACGRRELWTYKDSPWVLKCQRGNRCGAEIAVKDEYRELFESWSTRFKPTREDPTASADAYLQSKRRLNLHGMRSAYTQEVFHDHNRNLTSATIRFALPGGGWWERLIDQESRFDRKAHFKPKSQVNGHWWQRPDVTMEDLARADEVWICEGIFDAWALGDKEAARDDQEAAKAQVLAVANMSTNFYPDQSLQALRKVCGELNVPGPRLVWAFDNGRAGTDFTKKWVARAKKEGWDAAAAQPSDEDDTDSRKIDWNELKIRGRLTAEHLTTYRWYGDLLLAPDATTKAFLLWERHRWTSFYFTFNSQTYWASFDTEKIAEIATTESVTEKRAAQGASTVSEIANCAFRLLYFEREYRNKHQRESDEGERSYYTAITLPDRDTVFNEKLAPAAIAAAGEFKKALIGAAPGAQFTGSTFQLDRIVRDQTRGLKTVNWLGYIGYSADHGAWLLGDYAVSRGRVIPVNDEDYFDLGKDQLKLRGGNRLLKIDYDSDRMDTSWLPHLWTAWQGNGLVTLTFWSMSFFAQHIRRLQASLGYLEMSGVANTGKSTIILFLWKLCGLIDESFEGIDPSKSTQAGYIRSISSVSNLPVVFMEADRGNDTPHSKRFDWSEIKPLFMGQIGRVTGRKTQGNDVNHAHFRGALIIEQNDPVVSEEPVLSRIMPTVWTKEKWSGATKAAAERIEQWDREAVSGTMLHIVRREEAWLKTYTEAYPRWENHLIALKVRHARVRKCHAQLHAGLDALAAVLPIQADWLEQTHRHIDGMAQSRDRTLESDPKAVAEFWEAFDYLEALELPETNDPINRHRDPTKIAVNLQAFEARCQKAGISHPPLDELKRQLRSSRSRPFYDLGTVNGRCHAPSHCWVFLKEPLKKGEKHAA